jgi:hypothetical protein
MARPAADEHAPYHLTYLANVPEEDILPAMEAQLGQTLNLLRGVDERTSLVRHAPYTWSVREVVGHITDTERVFGYRALHIARGDEAPLPGFDENAYARIAESDRIPLAELAGEFEVVRRSNLLMFRHLKAEDWLRRGTANNATVSVRALAYMIVGHERHHVAILRQRLAAG